MDDFNKGLHEAFMAIHARLVKEFITGVTPAIKACNVQFKKAYEIQKRQGFRSLAALQYTVSPITNNTTTINNASCTICKHQWYTLDPFGVCPKCGSIPYIVSPSSTAPQRVPPPPLPAPVTNVQSGIALKLKSKTAIVDSLLQQGLISSTDYATLIGFPPAPNVSAQKVKEWLIANGFIWEPAHNMLSMYANCKQCWITDLDIYQDLIQVINTAEAWFKDNNILFQPWDGWDEETRKIDLEEFYGKKECQHEKGATPLMNSKNELWIICKKCGKDLELVKK